MRKHLPVLALLISLVIALGCSKSYKIPQAFSIVDSLSFECIFPLFTKYENGKYYTADSFDNTIKVFENGELINSFGGKGGGSGEFDDNPVLTLTDEYIVATSFSASRFSVFSKDGDFLYSNPIDSDTVVAAIFSLYFLNNEIIAYGMAITSEGEIGEYIGEMSLDGKLKKLTERVLLDYNSLLHPVPFSVLKDQIVYYQDNSHTLYFSKMDRTYNLKAIPTKLISAECKKFMKTMEEYNSKQTIPLNFPKYKQSFELDNRIFVQSQYQYYQYLMHKINHVYELNLVRGELKEVELPVEIDLKKWFISSGNKFMVLDEDEEQIREYEVNGI